MRQSIVAEAGATIRGALNFALTVNIRWLSVALILVIVLPLILEAAHGLITSPDARYAAATSAVLLAVIVSIVVSGRVWLSAERAISASSEPLVASRSRNIRLAARSLAGIGMLMTLAAYLFATSTVRGTDLGFPEYVSECRNCEVFCDAGQDTLYERGFHTEVTYERHREAIVQDHLFVLVDIVITKHENAPWDHEQPWLRRQYRGWILYEAPLENREGVAVAGRLRLVDYRLRPSAGIAAFMIGVIEIERIMRRSSEIVADPLQDRLCNRIVATGGSAR